VTHAYPGREKIPPVIKDDRIVAVGDLAGQADDHVRIGDADCPVPCDSDDLPAFIGLN
jgi:hypothetical protein